MNDDLLSFSITDVLALCASVAAANEDQITDLFARQIHLRLFELTVEYTANHQIMIQRSLTVALASFGFNC